MAGGFSMSAFRPETGKIGKKCVFEVDYFEKGSIVFTETKKPRPKTLRGAGNRPGIHPGANRIRDRKEHPK
jgi:hypothetical protein